MKPASQRDIAAPLRAPRARWLWCALVLLAAPAAGTVSAPEGRFGPGELLEYDVRYGPVPTGRARIDVGADRLVGGATVWPIVLHARTSEAFSRVYEVRDRFVTHWSPGEQRTLGFDFFAREGGKKRFMRARLDPRSGKATVHKVQGSGESRLELKDVGAVSHDAASAVFWLRTRPLLPGDVEKVDIFTGHRAFTVVATVEERARTTTPLGTWDTVQVRVQTKFRGKFAPQRDIRMWFTDDESHVLVRVEADLALGSMVAELSAYAPGARR